MITAPQFMEFYAAYQQNYLKVYCASQVQVRGIALAQTRVSLLAQKLHVHVTLMVDFLA